MVLRAYDEAGREARRQLILRTAEGLFARGAAALPSAAQIAEAAGLGKGTLYLYFRTKEEIFAALLLELWAPVLAMLEEEISNRDRKPVRRLESFIARLCEHINRVPALMRLDALASEVLERRMSHAALLAHRQAFMSQMDRTGRVLEGALKLKPGRGGKLVTRTHAVMRGLWQSFGDPAWSVAPAGSRLPVFAEELDEVLVGYWKSVL